MQIIASTSASRRSIVWSLVTLLLMTMIGVSISTASNITLNAAPPTTQTLTVDERTYYEFVAPRLDRLVTEVDDVVTMVDGKSRDIIALTVSGDRIQGLADEIVTFGEETGVPPRFASVHAHIVGGTDTVTDIFGEARSALRNLNFSHMTTLVTQFDSAAQTLHDAQEQLMSVAGVDPVHLTDSH